MNTILIGNIVSMIGAVLMVGIGLIRRKKQILIVQSVQFGIMGLGNLILGGLSGAISNALGVVRNIICLKRDLSMAMKLCFVVLQAGITLLVNKAGLLGWLPVIAAAAFTFCLDTKDERKLKAVMILGQVCWAVYDFSIHNYVSVGFDLFTIVSNVIGILAINKNLQKMKETDSDILPL